MTDICFVSAGRGWRGRYGRGGSPFLFRRNENLICETSWLWSKFFDWADKSNWNEHHCRANSTANCRTGKFVDSRRIDSFRLPPLVNKLPEQSVANFGENANKTIVEFERILSVHSFSLYHSLSFSVFLSRPEGTMDRWLFRPGKYSNFASKNVWLKFVHEQFRVRNGFSIQKCLILRKLFVGFGFETKPKVSSIDRIDEANTQKPKVVHLNCRENFQFLDQHWTAFICHRSFECHWYEITAIIVYLDCQVDRIYKSPWRIHNEFRWWRHWHVMNWVLSFSANKIETNVADTVLSQTIILMRSRLFVVLMGNRKSSLLCLLLLFM